MTQTKFTVLRSARSRAFTALLDIYRGSIEVSEQKTPDALAAAVRDPRYRFVAAERGGAVVGFAICFRPDDAPFWLLEYMATDQAQRSAGLGGAMFAWCRGAYAEDGVSIAVLEVDAPEGGPKRTARDRTRRLAFYARQGCRVLDGLAYELPLATQGKPPPMLLLAHAPARVKTVSKARLRGWLKQIYVEVYGTAPDDPRISRMVSPLPANVPLALLGE